MVSNKLQTKLFDLYQESKFTPEVDQIVKYHLDLFSTYSQLSVYNSLKESLKTYANSNPITVMLEQLKGQIDEDSVYYELETMLRSLEEQNQGMVYRPVMKVILDIMNETNIDQRNKKIMDELKMYDWVTLVAEFMFRYTLNPLEKQNLTSRGGKALPVYTFVETVEDGQLVYLKDKWYLISSDCIKPVVVFDYVKDQDRLHVINAIQTCLELCSFDGDIIKFQLSEDLTIGISVKTGDLFLNGEETEKSTSLEDIFNSPQIPPLKKEFYLIIQECLKNKSNFKNLDIALHVENILNPQIEVYAIKYANKCYAYYINKFSGNTFYQYENVSTLISDVNSALGFDLTEFFKKEVKDETAKSKVVQDVQKIIYQQIDDVNESLEQLEDSGLLETNDQIRQTYDMLKTKKSELIDKLKKLGDKIGDEVSIISTNILEPAPVLAEVPVVESNEFNLTTDDVLQAVKSNYGIEITLEKAEVILPELDAMKVEVAFLHGDAIEEQTKYAYKEIARQIFVNGLLINAE